MSEAFPYADIVILALIAGFILLRLRSVLGQKDDRPDIGGNNNLFQAKQGEPLTKPETIIQLIEKAKSKPKDEHDPYMASLEEGEVAAALAEIKNKDASFNATVFLSGAKMAFEMVFDAFAKGDKNTLQMLLSQDLYNHFANDIDGREKQEVKTETTLVSVAAKAISTAKLDKNMAQISVHFESEQVTVERGKNAEIVSGDPSDISNVVDEWVFERDITSKNPNWKIIET